MTKYVAPARGMRSFTCPHCGVLAQQHNFSNPPKFDYGSRYLATDPISTTICQHCDKFSIWREFSLVYPRKTAVASPSQDMPLDARAIYEEAASIAAESPRAAAALLRLAVQQLCVHFGG